MRNRTTKKVGIWIFAFTLFMAHLFLRTASAETGQEWKQVYAKSGECMISFPTQPQMLSQTLDLQEGQKLVYDVYLSPFESKGVFLLLVATYPAELLKGHEIAGVEGLLQGILNHNVDNSLVFSKMIEIGGNPAMSFLVENGQSYFRGQALMVGNKLFLLAMEGKKEFLEENVFLQFVKTFQITKK